MSDAPRREAPVFEVAALTDAGVKRAVNEDALIAADPCFLVADGMGGHDAGDVASRAAIDALSRALAGVALAEGESAGLAPEVGAGAAPNGPASFESVEAALDTARYEVARIASRSARGAGCTLTGAVRIEYRHEPCWYILNIGDSRVYLLRGAELTRLTADHSLREELIALGHSGAESTPRNVITRALGSDDPRHDAWLLPVEAGTRLLVCSDGLTSELSDEEIRAVMSVGGRPAAVAEELMRRACEAGGRDNISLIVLDTISGGSERLAGLAAQPWEIEAIEDPEDITLERTQPGAR